MFLLFPNILAREFPRLGALLWQARSDLLIPILVLGLSTATDWDDGFQHGRKGANALY